MKDSFGSVDTSSYGSLEVAKFKNQQGYYHGQVIIGTQIKHGRGCCIFEHYDGSGKVELMDGFFFNNIPHGPCMYMKPDGNKYQITDFGTI